MCLLLADAMVKLNNAFLTKEKNCKGLLIKHKGESEKEYLTRITHLKLQGRFIDKIELVELCPNVTFLYLQNNLLQTIENLNGFRNLMYLYLQRNKINKIENLKDLVHLRKVYLGYNEISIVENVGGPNLKELHIEYQNLPLGESLYFDPRTIADLAGCLKVLNVSGNNLSSLSCLKDLRNLRELISIDNAIEDTNGFQQILPSLCSLTSINLSSNPIALQRSFKENVILFSKSVCVINGTEVRSNTREFVEKRELARHRRTRSNEIGGGDGRVNPTPTTAVKFGDFFSIPKALLPEDSQIHNLAEPVMYPPWRVRKNVNMVPRQCRRPRQVPGNSSDETIILRN